MDDGDAEPIEVGSTFRSRETADATIRGQAKAKGYILKQSVTSKHRVLWYCSNKYKGNCKCPGSFHGVQESANGEWTIVTSAEHNEACGRARARILAAKGDDSLADSLNLPLPAGSTDSSKTRSSSPYESSTTLGNISNRGKPYGFHRRRKAKSSSPPTSLSSSSVAMARALRGASTRSSLRPSADGRQRSYTSPSAATLLRPSPPSPSSTNLGSSSNSRRSSMCSDNGAGMSPSFLSSLGLTVSSRRSSLNTDLDGFPEGLLDVKMSDIPGIEVIAGINANYYCPTSVHVTVTTVLDPAYHFPLASGLQPSAALGRGGRRKRAASNASSTSAKSSLSSSTTPALDADGKEISGYPGGPPMLA